MPSYRRSRVEGSTVFLTLVTHHRRAVFGSSTARRLLRASIASVRKAWPFAMPAVVLLPDHLHMLMALPPDQADYSLRVGQIKRRFTESYLASGGTEGPSTASRARQRYRGIWEKRFWEHTIRDLRDWVLHVEYIHANPVKHGLAARPIEWPWSSFRGYVAKGLYEPDWCGHVELPGTEYVEPW